jgi:hypothetical protein
LNIMQGALSPSLSPSIRAAMGKNSPQRSIKRGRAAARRNSFQSSTKRGRAAWRKKWNVKGLKRVAEANQKHLHEQLLARVALLMNKLIVSVTEANLLKHSKTRMKRKIQQQKRDLLRVRAEANQLRAKYGEAQRVVLLSTDDSSFTVSESTE